MKYSKIRITAVSIIIVIFCTVQLLSPQEQIRAQAFRQIFSRGPITDLTWSADGSLLSFSESSESTDAVVSNPNNIWHEYDPSTETLTTPAQWPRQPSLSSGEVALYQPATETVAGIADSPSFIFSSPNDDYIVYASNLGGNGSRFPVYIADLQNQIVAETYTEAWYPARGIDGLNVIWNRTSTAFVVTASNFGMGELEQHVQAHISNFSTTLTDLEMTSTDEITIAGHHYWPTEAYSVSDDGDSVLLRAVDVERNNTPMVYYLVIWNVSTNTSTIIGDIYANQIRTAAFDNGNPNELLMFNATGIVRYTVSTGETAVITTQINADWSGTNWYAPQPGQAAFSGDGQWLAVVRAGVYVFNLAEDFVGLKVQYYPEATTRTQYSESIEGHFNIINTSDVDVDLSDLTIRYFFSRDTPQPLQAACTWAALPDGCDDVVVTAGSWANYYSDSYLEIGFTAGTLAANSETQDIIARVNKQDFSDFNQVDDYSFDLNSNSDTFIDWDGAALYYKGKMVWGIEPS